MSMVLIIDTPPYGDERPYNGLRLAQALLEAGEWVELFFLGDGVHAAHAGQDPRGAWAKTSLWKVRGSARSTTSPMWCGVATES
jgi:sulfur relay (sulfurtransferase) complex TusBCD TusD component (DsrE family)